MGYIIEAKEQWEYVIGLEIHAQIISKSKLFSPSGTQFAAPPNAQVSLIDAAMPGMLPVLNRYCLEQAIKTGIALKATINLFSRFDRKNYFYPDLPQGYQISQFYHPVVQNGALSINVEDGVKVIRINRLHLEQDAGKSIHDQSPHYSFIDLNRSGIALMEIVTEPDLASPEEAGELVRKLRGLLRAIGTCDGDMEKGSMRCDANVSVRKRGDKVLGTRCEIKNLNSIRNIVKAIEYEGRRQVELLEAGEKVVQETRLFDAANAKTSTMRLKEQAQDYRYFPDPDLLPVLLSEEMVKEIEVNMPELPDDKISRYINDYGLTSYEAGVLVDDELAWIYFEETIKFLSTNKLMAKMACNWIISELFGKLNKYSISINDSKITPFTLSELLKLIENGSVSSKIAKIIFDEMFETGHNPCDIMQKRGLFQISSTDELGKIIDDVIAQNPEVLRDYQSGKEKLFAFFVGQVMKKTGGMANPVILNDLLKERLQRR